MAERVVRQMFKRGMAAFLALCLLTVSVAVSAETLLYEYPTEGEDTIQSPSAIMLYLGVKTEQDVVLYEKAADERYQPGALMRVAMAGYAMKLITEQKINMETATGQYTLDLFNRYVAGTGLHVALMEFGETWKVKDLLTMCTIQTVADAAVTLASVLSGSPEAFVEGLNGFSQELGCTNSHFTNVIGLNEEAQYMSARDVMVFSRYAMQYPEVRDMLELTQWTVQPVAGGTRRSWPSSNDFIRASSNVYYTYAKGGRTGGTLTELSLMEFGSHDGYEYMAIVMGTPKKNDKGEITNAAYSDARRLIRWGLIGFEYATLVRKSEPVGRIPVRDCAERTSLPLVPASDLTTVVAKGTDLEAVTRKITTENKVCTAPVKAGDTLGTLELFLDGRLVGRVPLVAGEDAPRNFLYALWSDICSVLFSGWFLGFIILLILLGVGYVVFIIRYNRKQNRRWKS